MTNHTYNNSAPVALTIAGFDPSGGAGVIADLKTFHANNCFGVAAITALTVQNTQGVTGSQIVDPGLLRDCIQALMADGTVKAAKIGMLGNRANAKVVREFLDANSGLPSVLDPVIHATSGLDLLDQEGLEYLRDNLLSRMALVTPNTEEAASLTGMQVETVDHMKVAARRLVEMGARAVVVTGGHLDKAIDVFLEGDRLELFSVDRIKPDATHGTGCTFSSAVAANLALGRSLRESVVLAKAYVTEAIRKAYLTGPGRMPLNHLYRMQQSPRVSEVPIAEPVH